MKKYNEAKKELNNLAQANMQKLSGYEFNEWLDGRTGQPKGEPYQGWSAGTYIYAYECVKRKKILFF
jgi:glycogen debranching enzyme